MNGGGGKTWDIDSWMLDIFPTIRSDGLIVLDRHWLLRSSLLQLRGLDGDVLNELIDSSEHPVVS